jgi:hypothetical protein
MSATTRKRLRSFSVAAFFIAFALIAAWYIWPAMTARQLVAAMATNDSRMMHRILDSPEYEEISALLNEYRSKHNGKAPEIRLTVDERNYSDILVARQTFRMEGYDSGHRFAIERGELKNLRGSYIFGGLELSR